MDSEDPYAPIHHQTDTFLMGEGGGNNGAQSFTAVGIENRDKPRHSAKRQFWHPKTFNGAPLLAKSAITRFDWKMLLGIIRHSADHPKHVYMLCHELFHIAFQAKCIYMSCHELCHNSLMRDKVTLTILQNTN